MLLWEGRRIWLPNQWCWKKRTFAYLDFLIFYSNYWSYRQLHKSHLLRLPRDILWPWFRDLHSQHQAMCPTIEGECVHAIKNYCMHSPWCWKNWKVFLTLFKPRLPAARALPCSAGGLDWLGPHYILPQEDQKSYAGPSGPSLALQD